MKVEVARYRKRDGYSTRHWAVFVNGDLLAVTVYRKGTLAVARTIAALNDGRPVPNRDRRGDPSPAMLMDSGE